MPYYKGLTLCSEGLDYKCGVAVSSKGANYLTINGTLLSFLYRPDKIFLIIDVNNKKKPNIIGFDTFYFMTNDKYELLPFGWYDGITRDDIKKGYKFNLNGTTSNLLCKKDNQNRNRYACTALLYLDNWEFKKDYPW